MFKFIFSLLFLLFPAFSFAQNCATTTPSGDATASCSSDQTDRQCADSWINNEGGIGFCQGLCQGGAGGFTCPVGRGKCALTYTTWIDFKVGICSIDQSSKYCNVTVKCECKRECLKPTPVATLPSQRAF